MSVKHVSLMSGLSLALLVLAVATAQSQNYPTKIIKIVVPYPAGGPTDLARAG